MVLVKRVVLPLFMFLSLGGILGGTELLTLDKAGDGLHALWLWLGTQSSNVSYVRLVWLFIFAVTLVMVVESVLTRNQPISVLSSSMNVVFLDRLGQKVSVSRTQYLRANHPHVTAYFTVFASSFGGWIERADISAQASINNHPLSSRLEIPPTAGSSSLEVAHIFEGGMPYGPLNVFVPLFLVRLLNRTGLQLPFVVRRDLVYAYNNEHTLADTYYQLVADRYAQRDVEITVKFHPDRPPKLSNGVLIGQSIKRNGIEDVYFTRDGETFRVTMRRLQNQRLRIPFRF